MQNFDIFLFIQNRLLNKQSCCLSFIWEAMDIMWRHCKNNLSVLQYAVKNKAKYTIKERVSVYKFM